MSTVILLGDPHLGRSQNIGKVGLGSNLNSRVIDQFNLLDWTLDQAIDCHADHIIITGDIFEDPKPSSTLITLFISWLKKCQVYDVNVHIIIGNHDILRTGNIYTSPLDIINEVELENVNIYKDINTVLIGTSAITFVPFRDRKSFSTNSSKEALEILNNSIMYELSSIPNVYNKILVGHLAIEGSIPVGDEIDDLTNELFCPINMFSGYDCVWMGHVHKPQIMHKSTPYISHIGSMDISNFGETEQDKRIVIVNLDDIHNFYTKSLPTRPLRKIVIPIALDAKDSTDYVINELKKYDDLDKAIVRLDISIAASDAKSVNKQSIEKYLLSKGASNVSGIFETKKMSLIKKDVVNIIDFQMDTLLAIKTYSEKYVDAVIKSEFIQLAMEILNEYKSEVKE
ncbi:SbcD DNA repair exonuclease [uncultured Caudovirales phage]|uniref:SbcD DNA repair exonuclease n=1 Tax=uncultured Caudovirales phage TaxID=2100421 RepID=A0A6J5RJ66_9CAUD|nr:SbcD DNA repair exonuclease [uncultured Caudovirales phage]